MSRFEELMKALITRGEGWMKDEGGEAINWGLRDGKITCHMSGKIIDLHDPNNEAEVIFNYCMASTLCSCCPLVNFNKWNCELGEAMLK